LILKTALDEKFKTDKNQKWNLFDRYFDDDFFSNRSDPFEEMERMQQQLDKLLSGNSGKLFNDTWEGWFDDRFFGGSSGINIDTAEKKDAYIITINIPNLKENKINIQIGKDGISIDGDFSQTIEKRDNDGNVINKHEMFKSISRTIPVPDGVDTDEAVIDQNGDNIIIRLPKKVP
jgi:HSP20 family molecular chaperone IbpA